MHVISEEAINFQPAAAPKTLANEMTALFQETIDYRNKITDSDSHRVQAVTDYFVKKVAPRLIKVVHTYTGIWLSISVPKYLMCNYAVAMEFENDPVSVDSIIRKYSGLLDNKDYPSFLKHKCPVFKTYAQLEEFANSLAKDTGIIKAGMMEKHKFKAKLYFDVYSAFLIKETGANACVPLTAHEVTAVILHEIGHVLSFVEHAADIVFKKDMLDLATKQFLKEASTEEKLKYVTKLSGTIYPKSVDMLNKVTDYIETKQKEGGSLVWSGFVMLIDTFSAILNTLGIGFIGIVTSIVKNIWDASFGGVYKSLRSIEEIKTGDFANTPMNSMYCEVLADEYVARFGYAGHLASQLQKLFQWSRITGLGDMYMKQFSTVSMLGRMLPWMIYTAYYGDKYSDDYPNEKKRYELLMLDTIKAFKATGLNDELLADYYKAYTTIKHMLENPTAEQKYINLCNSLHEVVKYLMKTPAELLFSGRFDREYARLYDQVNSLSNNEMYAMAYKLKTLNQRN